MFDGWTDEAIVDEMGRRLKKERLNRNLTRSEIATKAGISIKTIQNVEDGKGTTVTSLVRLMRALGLVARFDALVPEPGLSPIELLKLQGRERKRASGHRRGGGSDG